MSQQYPQQDGRYPPQTGQIGPYTQYPSQPPSQPYSQPLQSGYYPQQQPPIYPPMTPQQPPKKNNLLLPILIGVIVVGVALCGTVAIVANSASKTATTAINSAASTSVAAQSQAASTVSTLIATPLATQSQSASSSSSHSKVGDTVSMDSTWQVTVDSAASDPGDGNFNIPKAGNTYILIKVTLKNISDSQQNASGLVQFSLRDQSGNKYDESLTYSSDPGGKVAAGDPLKGTLAYEVPASTKSFVLNFTSDFTSTDQASWDITI